MYFLAERGERRPDGRQALLAYAVGCNPDTDPFDDWWHLAGRELGGDDFAEYFDPKDGLFTRLQHSADDLVLSATATHLSLAVVLSRLTRQPPRSPASGPSLFAPPPSPRVRVCLQPPRHAPPATTPACHRRQPHEHAIDLAEAAPPTGVAAHGQCIRSVAPSPPPPGPGREVRPGRHAERQRPDPRRGHCRPPGRAAPGRWKSRGCAPTAHPAPAASSTARPGRRQGRWATYACSPTPCPTKVAPASRAAGWRLIGARGGGAWSRPGRPRADTPEHLRGAKCL